LQHPSRFVFAIAQPLAVPSLKEEIAREHPDLAFAYSRPGLVTFKSPADVPPDFALRSVFARVWGASAGSTTDPEEVRAFARVVGKGKPVRLHVFERDGSWLGEPPPAEGKLAAEVREKLLGEPFLPEEEARIGDLVVDVVVAPDEPWWIGTHRHARGRWATPGGRLPTPTPPEAPSRAWRKMAEGLAWSGAPLGRGDVVLELGAAPGGGSYALLQRGAEVIGVDPEPIAPVVTGWQGEGSFTHVAKAVGGVRRDELPERIDWIAIDMSIAPQVALHSIQRFFPPARKTLRGVLLTLKLNEWSFALELPGMLDRVRALGMSEVRATHLPSDRQEVFVYGLTPKGAERLAGGRSRGSARKPGPKGPRSAAKGRPPRKG
jgi:23S rRNA (cytidine2498-2'-O)-methyltransferase